MSQEAYLMLHAFWLESTIAYGKWIWKSQLGFDGKEKGENVWMK